MKNKVIKTLLFFISFLVIFFLLFLLSRFNYLLFHSVIEFSAVIIGITLFIIVINTTKFAKNSFLFFIGISYLTISIIDFLHTLAFRGMGIFPGYASNLSTQLWISARYVEAISLFAASFFIGRKITKKYKVSLISSYVFILFLTVFIIFYTGIFPDCYVEGFGLTSFKIISEYIISLILLLAIIAMFKQRKKIARISFWLIITSIIITILSEMAFTLYTDVYGFFNMLGHLLKAISFFLLYKVLVERTLRKPYELLYLDLVEANKNLKKLSRIDQLTGMYNHVHALKEIKKQFDIAKRFNKKFSIIMMDIDNFKKINDSYGHPAGDEVLKKISTNIMRSVRDVDIKGRYGGDEFIICPLESGKKEAVIISEKIINNVDNIKIKKYDISNLTVSIGISTIDNKKDLENIIHDADQALLLSKRKGKNKISIN